MPRPRPKAVLKWTGLALCLLLFAVWFASRWFQAWATRVAPSGYRRVVVSSGTLYLAWGVGDDPEWPQLLERQGLNRVQLTPTANRQWLWRPRVHRLAKGPVRDWYVAVPLPLPALLLAAPTAWLLYLDVRSVRWAKAGRCGRCGYDLAALPAGAPCPECGKGAT